MAYVVNKYNGAVIATVPDGTVDSSLDIKLVGYNYARYGEIQNENFVFLLENFANTMPPPRPMTGQLWYDSASGILKFYDSTTFKSLSNLESSSTEPYGVIGDLWFNTETRQLFIYNGTSWTLIGPEISGEYTNTYVHRAGDTMTGLLRLSGDPVENLHAVPLQYLNKYVNREGDNMTGLLELSGDPTADLHAVPLQYLTKALNTTSASDYFIGQI